MWGVDGEGKRRKAREEKEFEILERKLDRYCRWRDSERDGGREIELGSGR
jgi:hypothetical protein